MIVVFTSSETGELILMADLARTLLKAIGKTCSAKGVITQPEMAAALETLTSLAKADADQGSPGSEDEGKDSKPGLTARLWPVMDMLRRTEAAGSKAYVMWSAPGPFEEPAR